MGKTRAKAAPKSVEVLVQHALKLAATNPKANWTGASAAALFNTKEENHQAAIAECTKPDAPLLKQVGKVGALTTAGFERVAAQMTPEEVAAIAKAMAAGMLAVERVVFLQGVIGRTSDAAPELTPLLDEAVAAKEVEQRAQDEAFRAQAAAKAANQAALERAVELGRQDKQNEIDSLLRRWEALGQKQDDLPAPEPEPAPSAHPRPTSVGTVATEGVREVAERLVSAWLYNTRHNKVEAATALERVLRGIDGIGPIGNVNEEVRFDGRLHECERGVSDGEPVRVIRPGWEIEGEVGAPLLRALVG